jgi:SPP1 family predicted phage head-tail adaptor
MRSGRLRHYGTIQRLVEGSPSQNAGGEPDEAWANFHQGWCDITPLAGRELVSAQQIASEVTGLVKLRYVSGVTPRMRFVLGSRNFDILAAIDVEERQSELHLYVREGPNNG